MSAKSKNYYLRLNDDFFESEKIIILESLQDGYMYSNILLKLYLRSLKSRGKLVLSDRIPYDSAMLAQITGHDVDVMEKALRTFEDLNLIHVLDNGVIYISGIDDYIGELSMPIYDQPTKKQLIRKKGNVRRLRKTPEKEKSGE